MKFYSSKGWIFGAMFPVLGAFAGISFADGVYVMALLLCVCILYLTWMWFDTWYQIIGDELLYRSALIKGSIKINAITEVIKNKTITSGVKPALSTKGIAIKYNKWDELYVSAIDAEGLIAGLKQVKPEIRVVD
ncbi:PH domain-containing protein [Mucilaginibacter auburnensis]|uniref:PH (Pleckstrin Homology) domain-containing protein n=1 Tax=Mucilaginibacter auburnensis TaxID=1457233 RepID=A0A2H9VRN3_9SPHI|nr:PH domain-containing protein [Mucilaginibacter auburnensis]PJJ83473.1 PH (Pleckstrin Homology) domain-containing protein [Mucilaginibacter auburnensis]